jgi:hypothetical protein
MEFPWLSLAIFLGNSALSTSLAVFESIDSRDRELYRADLDALSSSVFVRAECQNLDSRSKRVIWHMTALVMACASCA